MFGHPLDNTKGWATDMLKNVTSKLGTGATPRGGNASYKSEGISLIRSMHVYNGYFDFGDLAYIDEAQAKLLDNVTVEKGDVLLNITGASVARSCIVPDEVLPARVNQHVCIVRCIPERINNVFLNHMLTGDIYQAYLWNMAEAAGATRQALTKQQIENLSIILPPISLQEQFVALAQQSDKSKFVVSNRNLSSASILLGIATSK